MEKGRQIYEGKGKILFETDSEDYLILYFKDDTTCFNARKKGIIHKSMLIKNMRPSDIPNRREILFGRMPGPSFKTSLFETMT